LVLLAVLATFYFINIKNGIAYSIILLILFGFLVLNLRLKNLTFSYSEIRHWKIWIIKVVLIMAVGLISMPIVSRHIEQNRSWGSFWVDSKVAIQVDQTDEWKFWGQKGYPLNELGKPVSPTNYERLSWGIIGLRLLGDNPLGYGLVENSFGFLTKIKWPDSRLAQSHSGWLDLALGIGIPGIGLILGSLGLVIYRLNKKIVTQKKGAHEIWISRINWIFCVLILLWCTSEISFKTHLIALIFWISLGSGLAISPLYKSKSS
jgi:hypothetical protein